MVFYFPIKKTKIGHFGKKVDDVTYGDELQESKRPIGNRVIC